MCAVVLLTISVHSILFIILFYWKLSILKLGTQTNKGFYFERICTNLEKLNGGLKNGKRKIEILLCSSFAPWTRSRDNRRLCHSIQFTMLPMISNCAPWIRRASRAHDSRRSMPMVAPRSRSTTRRMAWNCANWTITPPQSTTQSLALHQYPRAQPQVHGLGDILINLFL